MSPSVKSDKVMLDNAVKAMRRAVRGVIKDRKMRGWPMLVWKNGKVVRIPASALK